MAEFTEKNTKRLSPQDSPDPLDLSIQLHFGTRGILPRSHPISKSLVMLANSHYCLCSETRAIPGPDGQELSLTVSHPSLPGLKFNVSFYPGDKKWLCFLDYEGEKVSDRKIIAAMTSDIRQPFQEIASSALSGMLYLDHGFYVSKIDAKIIHISGYLVKSLEMLPSDTINVFVKNKDSYSKSLVSLPCVTFDSNNDLGPAVLKPIFKALEEAANLLDISADSNEGRTRIRSIITENEKEIAKKEKNREAVQRILDDNCGKVSDKSKRLQNQIKNGLKESE